MPPTFSAHLEHDINLNPSLAERDLCGKWGYQNSTNNISSFLYAYCMNISYPYIAFLTLGLAVPFACSSLDVRSEGYIDTLAITSI